MRKIGLLACAVCLFLAWGLYGQGQDGEPRAIIDKAIQAHGGAKKLAAIKAVQMKGKGKIYVPMEASFTAEITAQPPDKQRLSADLEINNMNFHFVQVFDGKKGWQGVAGMIKELDADEVKEARQQAHVGEVETLIVLKDKSYKLSSLGESKVEGKDVVGVQVTKKGWRDVNLFFDKKTHLLLKAEYRALNPEKQEVTQEKLFLDYKDVEGYKAPGRMVINNDGKKFLDMEITEATPLETPLDASVFAKPE
jgi:hypothetical protein